MSFEVSISPYGEYAAIVLKDVEKGTFAEIYSFGALLNNFTSAHRGIAINVIDGFASLAEAIEKLTPFFKSAKLSPFVCRVKNSKYKFGKNDYLLSKYSSHGNALHGLVYDAAFEIQEHASNEKSASVKLIYNYDKVTEGYPFRFNCKVEYTLAKGNSLSIKTTITNSGSENLPVVDGWHPYFTLGDSINNYQFELKSKEMLEFDENLLPTGNLISYNNFSELRNFGPTELDNCFTLDFTVQQPLCVLRHPEKKVQIEFYPSKEYPYLQIYTPEHRKSIAIENLSGAPDAFNNGMGLKVLEPGEKATFTTNFITRSI